jgi:hypothetical protein
MQSRVLLLVVLVAMILLSVGEYKQVTGKIRRLWVNFRKGNLKAMLIFIFP